MRIFSGIQPTGAKTLGNYSGGFRQYAATQEQADEAFFCIVDLHSITVEYSPEELRETTLDLFAMLIATGLDPDRSTVFAQSHVTAHAEAAWLLSAVTSYGQLGRMTQFKDKGEGKEFVSAGLFTYPVLMAGDILLYQTDARPDRRRPAAAPRARARRGRALQRALRRDVHASRTGSTPRSARGSWTSRSRRRRCRRARGTEAQGSCGCSTTPDVIRKKFKTAVTDSGREVRRADGQAGRDEPDRHPLRGDRRGARGDRGALRRRRATGTFKADVGEAVVELLAPIQARYRELRGDPAELRRCSRQGAEKAREASAPTLAAMYDRMGFAR